MSKGICEGLQVIEMGAGCIAASLAGVLLADNGARVVKIEPPGGDSLRRGHPAGFLVWNRGKGSNVADLGTEDGRADVRRLLDAADVVIEGFQPGVAADWGLAYEDVASNPALVYCSIKGFGSKGPYATLKAYEGVVAAKAGVYTQGAFGFRPGPIYFSAPLASTGAGQMAFQGILAALTARLQTGRGQYLEATLVQGLNPLDYFGTVTWQVAQRMAASATGTGTPGKPAAGVAASRYSMFLPTRDGRWISTTQMLPHQARALSRACGLERTFDDPRFTTQPQFPTAEDAAAWEDLVWEAMMAEPYEHWEKAFLAEPDIAFELCRFSEEGLDHQQIRHNGEAIVLEDPGVGPVSQVGPVAHFRSTPARIERSAPALDERNGDLRPRGGAAADGGAPQHPFAGTTIVELGYFFAMPFGVTLAASLGARVIKLEGKSGDPMRSAFGLPETGSSKTTEAKESISIDLSTEDGRAIAQQIVTSADVFVNGFRSGVAERMGLDYDTLRQRNPRLVYVHATGYGTDGPYAARPIYAQVAQSVAGSVGRYAGQWLDPALTAGMSPVEAQAVVLPRVRGPVDGDTNAALAVGSTLALAIYEQRRSGTGQFVSTTMIGGNAWAYADDFVRYEGKPALAQPDEDNHGLHALYRLYPASSGWIFLAAPKQAEWEALVGVLDRPELARDERFATAEQRRANDDALTTVLAKAIGERDAAAWEATLSAVGVGCAHAFPGSHSEFTSTDPVMRDTGLVVEIEHPTFERVLRHGLPVSFSETPGRLAPCCLSGEHTEKILTELGYSAEQIEQLRADEVVFSTSAPSA